jgi:hypothetical protein
MFEYKPVRTYRYLHIPYPQQRHVKLDITDKKMDILLALGEMHPKDSGVQDGAIFDTSLAGQYYRIYKHTLDIDELRKRIDWKENCHWYVYQSTGDYGNIIGALNRTAAQVSARLTDETHRLNFSPPVRFFVPFKDSNFSTITVRVFMTTDDSKFFSNVPFVREEKRGDFPTVLPSLKITGPDRIKKEKSATLHISHVVQGEATGEATNIDLIALNGYLPKTRLSLPTGEGDFKIFATGLDAGDTIKIKAGFFFFPSATEHILTVE